MKLPAAFSLSPEVLRAQSLGLPLVALESTVITHGLPWPQNLQLARDMENEVRQAGVVPATIALVEGRVCVGIDDAQIERLASDPGRWKKISSRDIGAAIAGRWTGGTTVAGTMAIASKAGIQTFATGGIGGVHRQVRGDPASIFDISADLTELAHTQMLVVCAGAKAILDLRATLEVLETMAVPVVGYQTKDFPAFYTRSSGLPVSAQAGSPEEAARIAREHWGFGQKSGVLVAQPPPQEHALPAEQVEAAIKTALDEIGRKKIRGQEVTPYMLSRMSELTGGGSLAANIALLLQNARLAAQIARYLAPPQPSA
jgi:pseudouridylate synthase